ncbi:MAG: chromosomal replication initiator protein DnaA [Kiritimatiellae bacterium]|nr:chromosomal replication initiator protein DnaA [Kiritimatiellia bacterium]
MNNTATELWSKSCKQLAGILSSDVYDRWIALIEARTWEGNQLQLAVPNGFYQHWLEENYLPLIKDAVATVCGQNLDISILVEQIERKTTTEEVEKKNPSVQAPSGKPSAKPAKPTEELKLNPNYTFEAFVVGPSNNFAHAAALAVAQSPAKAYNPLFIYGGSGLGKTHLMQAVGHAVVGRRSRARISYISSETFVNEYIDALQKGRLVDFRKRYRSVDVLLIDDIHFLSNKERMQEEFFHTFNVLFDAHKQIVLTSDRPASEIPNLEQRLVSRFEWGLVTDLNVPDVETSIAILRKKQMLLNIQLPDELLTYMAERIRSNIRRLEGALIRAASYSSLTGSQLTVESLDELLRSIFDQEKKEDLSVERIQRTVSDHYDIRLSDMTRKCRTQAVAFPRQVAMYLCRTLTEQSTPVIGNAFGRDHATVIYACRKVTERLNSEPALRETISRLNQKLQA